MRLQAVEQQDAADEAWLGRSFAADLGVGRTSDNRTTPLTRLAGRLRNLLHGANTPPSPDATVEATYQGRSVVESHYSASGRFRAIITHHPGGHFSVHRQQWDISGWEAGGTPAWVPAGGGAIIGDTIERARTLAVEALRNAAAE